LEINTLKFGPMEADGLRLKRWLVDELEEAFCTVITSSRHDRKLSIRVYLSNLERFFFPVFRVSLYDAQSINPKIAVSKLACNTESFLMRPRHQVFRNIVLIGD
jgi:hypothetical protein